MRQIQNVGILGAAGYTGIETVRLLARHPRVRIAALGADKNAGRELRDIFPQFGLLALPPLQRTDAIDFAALDALLCAVPHGITQTLLPSLPTHLKIVDLSADFRLRDPDVYRQHYGHAHAAPELQLEAVFGLPEFYAPQIRRARLTANTGCYVAASLLALLPVIKKIDPEQIVIHAASGVSGAGRTLKENVLFTEVSEGFRAYGVGSTHRHIGEIDQELSAAAGAPVRAVFTPHLLPQNRGILASISVAPKRGANAADLHAVLVKRYARAPFVHVLPFGELPQTTQVRGSNYAFIGVAADRRDDRVLIVSAIDNLVRGAAGQAIQNLNLMLGFPETTGLLQLPLFP